MAGGSQKKETRVIYRIHAHLAANSSATACEWATTASSAAKLRALAASSAALTRACTFRPPIYMEMQWIFQVSQSESPRDVWLASSGRSKVCTFPPTLEGPKRNDRASFGASAHGRLVGVSVGPGRFCFRPPSPDFWIGKYGRVRHRGAVDVTQIEGNTAFRRSDAWFMSSSSRKLQNVPGTQQGKLSFGPET